MYDEKKRGKSDFSKISQSGKNKEKTKKIMKGSLKKVELKICLF